MQEKKLKIELPKEGILNDLINHYKFIVERQILSHLRSGREESIIEFEERWLEGFYQPLGWELMGDEVKIHRARGKYLSDIVSGENISISGGFFSEPKAINKYFLNKKGKKILDALKKGLSSMNDDISFYIRYDNNYSLPCEITINQKTVLTGQMLKTDEIKTKLKNYIPPIYLKHRVTFDINKYNG